MEQQRGFTLIEIMIALVIIAIIAGVALPTYQSQVVKSRRADCQAVLLGFAQAMEKRYALNYSYLGSATAGADTGAPANTLYPAKCPTEGTATYYNLAITAATATSYTLRATPASGSSQADDGRLEVNELGQRFRDKDNDGNVTDSGENNWD